MGAVNCLNGISNFILFLCATIYVLIGLSVMVAAGATFFTFAKAFVPPLYAGSAIAIGAVIFVVGIFGYAAMCSKRKRW